MGPEEIRQQFDELLQHYYQSIMTSEDIDTWPIGRLRTRQTALKEAWDDFYLAHRRVVVATVDPDDHEANTAILIRNEAFYLEAKEVLDGYINGILDNERAIDLRSPARDNQRRQAVAVHRSTNQGAGQQVIVHIEKPLDVPTFNGDYLRWREFKGAFTLEVINRERLSEHEKLKALHQALTGAAKDRLGDYDYKEGNFDLAWAWLCSAYDDDRKTIDIHLATLRNLPDVKHDDIKGLTTLINKASVAVRSLKDLRIPVEQWNAILVHFVEIRLDDRLKDRWESARSDRVTAEFSEIIKCLENILRRLIQAEFNSVQRGPQENDLRERIDRQRYKERRQGEQWHKEQQRTDRQRKEHRYHPYRNRSPAKEYNNRRKSPMAAKEDFRQKAYRPAHCIICNKDHKVTQCEQYLAMKPHERSRQVMLNKLCRNCLHLGHVYRDCFTGSCRACPGEKHHPTLCPKMNKSSDDSRSAKKNGEAPATNQ